MRNIFKPFGWAMTWILYGLGHITSKLIPWEESIISTILCNCYVKLMCTSSFLQDYFRISEKAGPWGIRELWNE